VSAGRYDVAAVLVLLVVFAVLNALAAGSVWAARHLLNTSGSLVKVVVAMGAAVLVLGVVLGLDVLALRSIAEALLPEPAE
jgi:hypothetical protein